MNYANFPISAPDRILRVPETASALGISKSSVWRFAKMGKLKPVKVSERVTGFRLSDVQALIAGAK
jgi:predicted DNA-binding transcriptional regulator AlpA